MANRSYLYVIDRLPEEGQPLPTVRGVHENNYDVPLLHTLLVSGDPVEYPSLIWPADPESDWPAARCIVGDARQGIEKLEQAFAALPSTPQTQEKFERARAALTAAVEHGSYFVLEHAEITHEFAEDAAEAQLDSDRTFAAAQQPDLSVLQQSTESLIDEVTGASGFWSEHLYYAPAGTAAAETETTEAPVVNTQSGPPVQQAPQPQPQPKKKLPLGARIGIIIASVVVGIPLLLFIALQIYGAVSAPSNTVSDAAAIEAVEDYFDALSAGDVESALDLTTAQPDDQLLTQAVLDRSNELAPITDVVVKLSESGEPISKSNKVVVATFTIGDVTTSKEFSVSGWDGKADFIVDALVSLDDLDRRFADLDGLTVNGATVSDPSSSIRVFPGAYEIGLENEFYELKGDDVFFVGNSEDAAAMEKLEPEVTQMATDTFRSLVAASLAECLTSKEASSPCGIDIPTTLDSGETVIAGTVTRTLTPDGQSALDSMVPEPDFSDPMVLTGTARFSTKITASFIQDGQTVEGEVAWGFGNTASDFGNQDTLGAKKPSVDFRATTPVVVWG